MDCTAKTIAEALSQPVRLKTWSLIVTIFGDAVLPHGGSISAQALNEITSAMGINSGAVRTALSRLASDGYIERSRIGRSSLYRLAADREQEFLNASDRIYADPDKVEAGPAPALVSHSSGQSPIAGAIRLSREWWLVEPRLTTELSDDCAVFEGRFSNLPVWMIDRVASPELARFMRQLIDLFGPLQRSSTQLEMVDSVEAVALRCLLIHAWRRIALRLPELPGGFEPRDWPQAECHRLVADLHRRLQPQSDKWLGETLGIHVTGVSAGRFSVN